MIPLVAMAAANVVASLKKETDPFTLSEIAEATAEEYGIPTVRLLGKGRRKTATAQTTVDDCADDDQRLRV